MEEYIKALTLYLAMSVEAVAVIFIGVAVIRCVSFYTKGAFRGSFRVETFRLQLGKDLVLALEFLLAADILRTAIAPTWDDIGKLAAIAALRTLLNYFLAQELKKEQDINEGGKQVTEIIQSDQIHHN